MGKKKGKGKKETEPPSDAAAQPAVPSASGESQQTGKQKKGKDTQQSTSQEARPQGQGRQPQQQGRPQQQQQQQQQQAPQQSGQNPWQGGGGRGHGQQQPRDGGHQQTHPYQGWGQQQQSPQGRGQQQQPPHGRGQQQQPPQGRGQVGGRQQQSPRHSQQQPQQQPQQQWGPPQMHQQPQQQPQQAWGPPQQQPPQQAWGRQQVQQPPQPQAWGPPPQVQQQQPQMQHQQARGPPPGWVPPQVEQPLHVSPPMQQQAAWGRGPAQGPQVRQEALPQQVQLERPQSLPQEAQQQPTAAGRKGGQQTRPQQPKGGRPPQAPTESPRGGGDSGVVQTTSGMEKMSVQGGGDVPLLTPKLLKGRRTGGKQCRKRIMVVTNHFPLDLGTLTKAYHYDVDIVPDKPKKLYRPAVEAFRRMMFKDRYPAFDGVKNLYSAKPLCDGTISGNVTVMEDDRSREFKVTIKQVAYIDLSSLRKFFQQIDRNNVDDKPMQAMQCIDVVLRSAALLSFLPVGRSFFQERGGQRYQMGDGTELYNGFYQSAIVGWKPFLNMDVTHKVFAKSQTLIDFIGEISRGQADKGKVLHDELRKSLSRHVRQLKVEYKLPNNPASRRVFRVNDIGEPAVSAKFDFTDEKTKATKVYTVLEYYAKEKRQNLKYPLWPTLWVGNKNRTILIPLEFCTVLSGQAVNRAINDMEKRNMIRHTATSAPDRLGKITNFMKEVKFKECQQLDEFGIKVNEQPHVVEARVLQPPNLEYSDRRQSSVRRGAWRANRFIAAATIKSWTIICLDDRTSSMRLDQLEKELINSGMNHGVNMCPADRLQGRDFKRIRVPYQEKQLLQQLEELFKSLTHELIVVVIPGMRKFVYHYVKQASELRAGKLTQCIKSNTVERVNSMTTDNLMLKINAKLNGTNHKLSPTDKPGCLKRPFVIMGADVTHPGPESTNIPSVAAVTCSFDAQGFKYTFSWRLQGPKVEIIQDLEEIVRDQLMYFYRKNNNVKPEYLFFFRDGVSDGQFQQVLSSELTAIRRACTKLQPGYEPKITFLVVQKRHHTRFFPKNPADSEDKCLNVPAGTCVDTEITHPCALDFYLVSHASIQGVARPTKYRILWDDSNMTEDEIESLTYYLCHLFARCNRSVSYPTPTYYAHLAAARGKVYCETDQTINMSKLDDLQNRLMVNGDFKNTMPMYFV